MAIAHKEKEGEGEGRERGLVEDGKEGRELHATLLSLLVYKTSHFTEFK